MSPQPNTQASDPTDFSNYKWTPGPTGRPTFAAIHGRDGRAFIGLRGRNRATGLTEYVSAELDADGIQAAITALNALLAATIVARIETPAAA